MPLRRGHARELTPLGRKMRPAPARGRRYADHVNDRDVPAVPEPPELPSGVEAAIQTGVQVLAAAIPVFGPVVGAGLEGFASHASQRSLVVWAHEVSEVVEALRRLAGRSVAELLEDDVWLDAVARASLIASTSRQKERRRALRNALFNIGARDGEGGSAMAESLLRLLDMVTPAHMRYLGFARVVTLMPRVGRHHVNLSSRRLVDTYR